MKIAQNCKVWFLVQLSNFKRITPRIWYSRAVADGEFYWLDGTILTPSEDYFTSISGLNHVYLTEGHLTSNYLGNTRRFICQYGTA